MDITFQCIGKGCSPRQWEGNLQIVRTGNPCEAEVTARGSRFHLIAGTHTYGNYVCIPNWNVGTELASMTDTFWNQEHIRRYTCLKKVDACTVVAALAVLNDFMKY